MNKILPRSIAVILFASTLTIASRTFAQTIEATKTTTTSHGTVSEFGPQGIVIKTEAGIQPVRYMSNETTNYVDENGNPVTAATVTSGQPVTVYYTKVGDTLIASKIMVRKAGIATEEVIETTTITTTTKK